MDFREDGPLSQGGPDRRGVLEGGRFFPGDAEDQTPVIDRPFAEAPAFHDEILGRSSLDEGDRFHGLNSE